SPLSNSVPSRSSSTARKGVFIVSFINNFAGDERHTHSSVGLQQNDVGVLTGGQRPFLIDQPQAFGSHSTGHRGSLRQRQPQPAFAIAHGAIHRQHATS